jgi:hypothetical protein
VGRPIRSIGGAGAFVDDVGFALLFSTAAAALPLLYEAASQQPLPLSEMEWGRMRSGAGWPRAAAGAALEELVERGEAVGAAGAYRPARSAAHAEDHARRARGRA